MPVLDVIALSSSLLLAGVYGVWLIRRSRKDSLCTHYAVNSKARTAWTRYIMANDSRAILAVQTLRNSTMAATFFASTAIILLIGALNLAGHTDKLSTLLQFIPGHGPVHPTLWTGKILLLVLVFIVAFFYFSIAVRLYNHVGYQVALREDLSMGVSVEQVAANLNQAGFCYMVGMRCYFAAVPCILWMFGAPFMILGSLVTLLVLWKMDRPPTCHSPILQAAEIPESSQR